MITINYTNNNELYDSRTLEDFGRVNYDIDIDASTSSICIEDVNGKTHEQCVKIGEKVSFDKLPESADDQKRINEFLTDLIDREFRAAVSKAEAKKRQDVFFKCLVRSDGDHRAALAQADKLHGLNWTLHTEDWHKAREKYED